MGVLALCQGLWGKLGAWDSPSSSPMWVSETLVFEPLLTASQGA